MSQYDLAMRAVTVLRVRACQGEVARVVGSEVGMQAGVQVGTHASR